MTFQISAEQMQVYRRTARQRWQAEQAQLARRRERAWELARQAAEMLRRDFAAVRVVVFGSLVQEGRFTEWSDVDLAAWGLDSKNWLKAIGAVQRLSDEIELNVVDVGSCSPELLAAIEREGEPL
jgi:predicted nucleotidyltransferase